MGIGYDTQNLRVAMEDAEGSRRVLLDDQEEYAIHATGSGARITRFDRDFVVDDVTFGSHESGRKEYFVLDAAKTVYKVVSLEGQIAKTFNYDVFGRQHGDATSSSQPLFQGRAGDVVGAYHRSRYYLQDVGRWLTADPIGVFGGPNRYLFVDNRPTMLTDATGLLPWLRIKDSCRDDCATEASYSLLQALVREAFEVVLPNLRQFGFEVDTGPGGRKYTFKYRDLLPLGPFDIDYECDSETGVDYAQTSTWRGRPQTVVFPEFWRLDGNRQVGVIVHEVVHAAWDLRAPKGEEGMFFDFYRVGDTFQVLEQGAHGSVDHVSAQIAGWMFGAPPGAGHFKGGYFGNMVKFVE